MTSKYFYLLKSKNSNDVNGGKDPKVLELVAANHNLNYICMKSIVLPADKKIRIESTSEIYDWVGKKIEECEKYGIQKERLIIDPGLGFSTNSNQSMDILKNVKLISKNTIMINQKVESQFKDKASVF